MGEFFGKLLEMIVKGDKSSIMKIIFLGLAVTILFPIVSNYFYGNIRLEQQLRILNELNQIDRESIRDPRMIEYYESIVEGLQRNKPQQTQISIINDAPKTILDYFDSTRIAKFISGSIWWLILLVSSFFTKQDSIGQKVGVIIVLLVIVLMFGIGGVYIPTFNPFVINYLGFPVLQIILVVLISILVSKLNKKKIA